MMVEWIRGYLFSPWHKAVVSFSLPAIAAGAFGAGIDAQIFVGLLGVVALIIHSLATGDTNVR